MRRHIVSAACGTLLLVACGGQSTCGSHAATTASTPAASHDACRRAQGANHAYLIVQHVSGATMQVAVGFASDAVDGKTLMDCSQVQYQTSRSGVATLMCQIDREPSSSGGCSNPGRPHWALFVFSGGRWSQPGTDFVDVELHDQEAMGWRYVASGAGDQRPPPQPQ